MGTEPYYGDGYAGRVFEIFSSSYPGTCYLGVELDGVVPICLGNVLQFTTPNGGSTTFLVISLEVDRQRTGFVLPKQKCGVYFPFGKQLPVGTQLFVQNPTPIADLPPQLFKGRPPRNASGYCACKW